MPRFGIAAGDLLPNAGFAILSVRRFCVENLSNEAAPYASNDEAAPVKGCKIACINGRKEPPLVSIPEFALRCKNILEFTARRTVFFQLAPDRDRSWSRLRRSPAPRRKL